MKTTTLNGVTNGGSTCRLTVWREPEEGLLRVDVWYDELRYYDVDQGYIHIDMESINEDQRAAINQMVEWYFAGKINTISRCRDIQSESIVRDVRPGRIIPWAWECVRMLWREPDSLESLFGGCSRRISISPRRMINALRRFDLLGICAVRETAQVLRPHRLRLGGTWQRHCNPGMLDRAEAIKGGTVYLAR